MTHDPEKLIAAAQAQTHVPLLASLAEKADPRHTALLVIDMQNDFCADDGFVRKCGRDVSLVQAMAKRLPPLLEAARMAGVRVVFVRSVLSATPNLFLSDVALEQAARRQNGAYTLSPVCADGSWEGDYYGDVRPQHNDIVITKHRYNAFHGTELDLTLRANGIRTVIVTGVSTNVCVESTARDAFMRDYYTVTVGDGSAAYSQDDHDHTLKVLDRFFGEVTTVADLTRLWSRRNSR